VTTTITPTHLQVLEAEAIHIIREVAAELERPVLLFSGGKDSIVLAHLAAKAFRLGDTSLIPFPMMHVDTGHNFPEVIEFRDRRAAELGVELIVASVQESIDTGRAVDETGPRASRNRLQTVTLLDAIEAHGFDAAFGGARRDEERARAKERIFSFRDDFGQWDPRNQRAELWNLYNGRIRRGEHVRVFPISNWTELDVRDALRRVRARGARRRRGAVHRQRPLPHRRGPHDHRRRALRGDDDRRRDRRDRRHADHRARRDPRGRPHVGGRDGGPQAGGLFLG
jgi:sulfate adenylyltransferase subunit 2